MSIAATLSPFIFGKGRAGQAIAEALATLRITDPDLQIAETQWLPRDANFEAVAKSQLRPILFISNPQGLHAATLLRAAQAGFFGLFTEKPACVSRAQMLELKSLKLPVAVFHVYRQMWGVQQLKKMIVQGEFGDLIAIEGRYWQSSAAEKAIRPATVQSGAATQILGKDWKDQPALSGHSDTLLDVGTHWIDSVCFLAGRSPQASQGWLSYLNAHVPHRDTHVQVQMDFGTFRAMGSISKTMHGASNHFEVNVMGTKKSGTWNFLNPDEILIGTGRAREVLVRATNEFGSHHPAYHAMGWVEGYTEICRQHLNFLNGNKEATVIPTLQSSMEWMPLVFDILENAQSKNKIK